MAVKHNGIGARNCRGAGRPDNQRQHFEKKSCAGCYHPVQGTHHPWCNFRFKPRETVDWTVVAEAQRLGDAEK